IAPNTDLDPRVMSRFSLSLLSPVGERRDYAPADREQPRTIREAPTIRRAEPSRTRPCARSSLTRGEPSPILEHLVLRGGTMSIDFENGSRARRARSAALTVAVPLCAVFATSAHAHHGVANFDLNKDIALEGVITSVEFVNPHSWLHFDVTGADGKVT